MSWGRTARAQAGVITRTQLRGHALADDVIDRLISNAALVRAAPGVFLARGAPHTYEAQLWIAVCATGGTLGFGSAAHLWGVVDQAPERITVIVPSARRATAVAGVRIRRSDLPAKQCGHRNGLPVTGRLWSLLDHLGELSFPDACTLADRAIQRGWLTPADLERRLERFPGRWGNGSVRRVASVVGDGAAAHSERLLHRLLRDAGLNGWVPNLDIWFGGSLLGVADVAFPHVGLIIEVDGMAHHVAPDRFQRDRSRQNDLVTAGWTVLRFTWPDLTQRPRHVVAVIGRQLELLEVSPRIAR